MLAITAECEKVFRQHSAGLVREIPLQQVRADIFAKAQGQVCMGCYPIDASLAKSRHL